MVVICEICGHHLATTTRNRLALPLTAAMFDPPEAGYPRPFLDGADWMWMRCPMCNKRPFIREDAVLTDEGLVELGAVVAIYTGPKPDSPDDEPVGALIARFKAEGLSNSEIGERLGMTRQKVTALLR